MKGRIASYAVAGCMMLWLAQPIAGAAASVTSVKADDMSTTVPGQIPTVVKHSTTAGQLSPTHDLHLSLALKWRNEAALQQLLSDLYNPSSPNYHHFLSAPDFQARFAPSKADVNLVSQYLCKNGMHVNKISSNHLVIDVSGTPTAVSHAFGVHLKTYHAQRGSFFAPDNEVVMPHQVANRVEGVVGLDNASDLTRHMMMSPRASGQEQKGYTPSTIQKAYGFTSVYNNWRGKGQTIAVVTSGTIDLSDLSAFDSRFGLPDPLVSTKSIDGDNPSTNEETTLDVEWSHAIASSANIQIYNAGDASSTSFTDAFNQVANDNTAHVVTTSWGAPEESTPDAAIRADHAIFQEMAAQGQSVFAAAGDNGSSDGLSGAHVDYPSSDSYVTACGGTSLSVQSDGTWLSEQAWSHGGGGLSNHFGQPSWQYGPGISQTNARLTSDISLTADPARGYDFYYNGHWHVGGGTSFVAPEMAATFALVDQSRALRGESPIGLANLGIYSLGRSGSYANQVYHDITSGSNGAYGTGTGYDHPTGWGSINAYYFINGLN